MKPLFFAVLLVLAIAAPVYAQEPTPEPEITGFSMPYTFEPVDIEGEPTGINLGSIIGSVPFINKLGSYVVTLWVMLDEFAGGGVLAYFVIILLGIGFIRWVASFVYGQPIHEAIDIPGFEGVAEPQANRWLKAVNILKRRPRF